MGNDFNRDNVSRPLGDGRKAKFQVYGALAFLFFIGILLYFVSVWRPSGILGFSNKEVPVSSTSVQTGDFFSDFRISREKVVQEQMDLIKKVIDDPKASDKAREEAHLQYLAIVDAMGKELKIEGILKSKGWDSLAFISGDSCTVVVRATTLGEKEVAQIGDVVKRIAQIPLANINVIPSPP